MKKVGVFLLILIVLVAIPVIAQSNSSNSTSSKTNSSKQTSSSPAKNNSNLVGVDKAYQCLEDLVNAKDSSSDFSLQEAVFATLALGANSDLEDKIDDEEKNDCWPKSSCTLRDTAQVLLAYDRIGKNTEDIEDYLLDNNGTANELSWFLEIDLINHKASSCTIKQASSTATINIGEDLKISGNPGSCLTIVESGFWLKIKSSCYDKEFEISCEEDFITTLLYQKDNSDTLFISPTTHSASSSGTTTEKIAAQCFKSSGSCDYEGTLWSALVLHELNYEVSAFVPYLLAFSEENKRFFPSSFLYVITSGEDQYSEIVNNQVSNDFFQAPSTRYNKFYDTSLALIALEGSSSTEAENARAYLLDSQTPKGCWNNDNIRDTAFILYSAWPKAARHSTGGSSGGSSVSCESSGYSCDSTIACTEAGGKILSNYQCSSFGDKCCSLKTEIRSCDAIGGIVCSSSQKCSSKSQPSLDGSCCLGACITSSSGNQCESAGGICASSCEENEDQTSLSCDSSNEVCCELKEDSSSKISILWIMILIFLILLVVLAILFRKKLEVWWFKLRKGKGMSSSQVNRRPPFNPPTATRPTNSSFGRPIPRQIIRRPETKTDKEMEEVFKKLRDIGK